MRSNASRSSDRPLYYIESTLVHEHENATSTSQCGRQFQAVYSEDLVAYKGIRDSSEYEQAAAIDAASRQAFGIKLARAERIRQTGKLRLTGRVAADPTRIYRVNIAADGFVKEVSDTGVGSYVKKDQRLAVIYSQEFLSVAGGYLSASERTQGKEILPTSQGVAGPQNWADRLRNLGMSDSQIAELTITRRVPEVVYINSPIDGFILARNISPGQKFDRYTDFYRIADLERVWIIGELFPNEPEYFRPGDSAQIRIPDQNHTVAAKVAEVLPQVNASTRTLQVRLEAENRGFALRPDMVVDVDLPGPRTAAVTIPDDAVLHSDNRDYVYVGRHDSLLEQREVEVGRYSGNRVEILKGLSEGEQVVASGGFLVDAEKRLHKVGAGARLSGRTSASAFGAARCALPPNAATALASGRAVAYGGTTYYFCSKVCRDKFEEDPAHYLASQPPEHDQ
ncbi:MAG TPA: efflux RND transporter periplasmic adaptor subunit [Terriglobales bacterium]|nr:efflux RND transporter periplasmic adaptor subunit [Terriglobales bacterium]